MAASSQELDELRLALQQKEAELQQLRARLAELERSTSEQEVVVTVREHGHEEATGPSVRPRVHAGASLGETPGGRGNAT